MVYDIYFVHAYHLPIGSMQFNIIILWIKRKESRSKNSNFGTLLLCFRELKHLAWKVRRKISLGWQKKFLIFLYLNVPKKMSNKSCCIIMDKIGTLLVSLLSGNVEMKTAAARVGSESFCQRLCKRDCNSRKSKNKFFLSFF